MSNQLQDLFKLSSNKCTSEGCLEKPIWQPVMLLFSPCEDKGCNLPHFGKPAVIIRSSAYCDTHKKAMKYDDCVPEKLWDKFCSEFRANNLPEPRQDWTSVSFHRIPDNIVQFGPRLVPTNPEPTLPGA